jgi:hypothetical protein
MENKYLIGLGGVAVIGFLAYSLTEENKRNKDLREKEVLAKETEMANKLLKTQSELKAKLEAEAKAKALADSRYTPAQATAKALAAIAVISDYLSKLTPEEVKQANKNLTNFVTPTSVSAITNSTISNPFAKSKMLEDAIKNSIVYKSVGDVVSNFKSNGAASVNSVFKAYFAENPKDTVDGFVKIYPKVFFMSVFEPFPLIDKVKKDFDFSPEEDIWISENIASKKISNINPLQPTSFVGSKAILNTSFAV